MVVFERRSQAYQSRSIFLKYFMFFLLSCHSFTFDRPRLDCFSPLRRHGCRPSLLPVANKGDNKQRTGIETRAIGLCKLAEIH